MDNHLSARARAQCFLAEPFLNEDGSLKPPPDMLALARSPPPACWSVTCGVLPSPCPMPQLSWEESAEQNQPYQGGPRPRGFYLEGPIPSACDDVQLARHLLRHKGLEALALSHISSAGEESAEEVKKQLAAGSLRQLLIGSPGAAFMGRFNEIVEHHLSHLALRGWLGHLPLDRLLTPTVRSLDLTGSFLDDEQLCERYCPHLDHLSLGRAGRLGRVGLLSLGSTFPAVRSLELSYHPLLPERLLEQLPKGLEHLSLRWSGGVEELEPLEGYCALRRLDLAHTSWMKDGLISKLTHLPLETLDLSYCRHLTFKGIDQLLASSKLGESLTTLSLRGLTLAPDQWREVGQLCLEAFSAPAHTRMEQIKGAMTPSLKHLDLGSCRHWEEAELIELLAQPAMQGIETLLIEEAGNFSDKSVEALATLPCLRRLRLWGAPHHPQLLKRGISSLSSLPALETLELSYSGICDLHQLIELAQQAPALQTLALGPLYKVTPAQCLELRLCLHGLRVIVVDVR